MPNITNKAIKSRRAMLMRQLAELDELEEQYGKINGLEKLGHGAVVKFTVRYDTSAINYHYAAMSLLVKGELLWFVTGDKKKHSYLTFSEFASLYLTEAQNIQVAATFHDLDEVIGAL